MEVARRYCRTSVIWSALSGTRRHVVASTSSKRHGLPRDGTSISSSRSMRHCVKFRRAIAASQPGFTVNGQSRRLALVIPSVNSTDRRTALAHDRPIAGDLLRRFRRRAGGGGILQKQNADARRRRFEDAVFDLAEFHDRFALGIEQVKQIVIGEIPARDIRHQRKKICAIGVEFDLEAAWAADRF